MDRAKLMLAHRYVGLVIAAFLVSAGLTGGLLAWKDKLEVAAAPALQTAHAPTPNARPLDPLELRTRVLARYPGAAIPDVPLETLPGRSSEFFLEWPESSPEAETRDNDVFVDPYTGEWLGARRWGDIGQGTKNLVPFLYRLHYSLALGVVGNYLFGVVALLWTLDCFVGLWLSLPAAKAHAGIRGAPGRLARWSAAWTVRRHGGAFKRLFDLHRAGALWAWAMLFVLAWSAVSFSLREVYRPTMHALFAHQPDELPTGPAHPSESLMSWPAARERGRELMRQAAQRHRFDVLQETTLGFDSDSPAFCYQVRSTLDPGTVDGRTRVCFDGATGESLGTWFPTSAARGDTIDTWLASLHRARVGGTAYRVFASAMGVTVALLAVTGVWIWWRKRRGRLGAARLRAA